MEAQECQVVFHRCKAIAFQFQNLDRKYLFQRDKYNHFLELHQILDSTDPDFHQLLIV